MSENSASSFNGFSQENQRITPIPVEFFHELLPQINHLGELKITLYAFWALAQAEDDHPHLRRSFLLADAALIASLPAEGMSSEQALDEALERAVQRGTLLMATSDQPAAERFYFLNAPRGRRTIEALRSGSWQPTVDGQPVALKTARPNIFVLYEQNIGALTPLLAERLQEAEQEYPYDWIEQAIRIAIANNVRKWRYIEAILENWKTKGKDDEEDRRDLEETRRRYLGGEFAEYIKH